MLWSTNFDYDYIEKQSARVDCCRTIGTKIRFREQNLHSVIFIDGNKVPF